MYTRLVRVDLLFIGLIRDVLGGGYGVNRFTSLVNTSVCRMRDIHGMKMILGLVANERAFIPSWYKRIHWLIGSPESYYFWENLVLKDWTKDLLDLVKDFTGAADNLILQKAN